jgi:hypothetical protein
MRAVVVLGLLVACSGPPATDAVVCRDIAHRLCVSQCGTAYNQLNVALTSSVADCDALLNGRTGCNDEGFMFANRAHALSCRTPLLRNGDDVETAPTCEDIDEVFRLCPEVLSFYKGAP